MKKLKPIISFMPAIATVLAVIIGLQVGIPSDLSGAFSKEASDSKSISEAKSKKKINRSSNAKKVTSSNSAGLAKIKSGKYRKSLDGKSFKDGNYIGTGKGFRGITKVRVSIKKGKIKSISILSSNDDASFFAKAKSLIPKIISSQNTNVDTISGATYSSNGILEAVDNALIKAVDKEKKVNKLRKNHRHSNGRKKPHGKKPKPPKQDVPIYKGKALYNDGTYIQSSREFFCGYGTATVTISKGFIKNIQISSDDEKSENGIPEENKEYYFLTAKNALIPLIIKQQSTKGLDTVTGATFSSNGILESVSKALNNAKIKKSERK